MRTRIRIPCTLQIAQIDVLGQRVSLAAGDECRACLLRLAVSVALRFAPAGRWRLVLVHAVVIRVVAVVGRLALLPA